MPNRCIWLTAVAVVMTASVAAQAADSFSCEVKVTATRDAKTAVQTSRLWVAGPAKFRVEQSHAGETGVMIVNGSDVWLVDTKKKQGQHRKLSPAEAGPLSKNARVAGDVVNDFIKGGGKKTGQEAIEGVRYDVYKRPAKNGITATLWALPGPRKLARRILIAGSVKAAPGPGQPMKQMTIHQQQDFSNWQLGKPMAETLFRPAAGVKITEAAPPAGGLPGAPLVPPGGIKR